MHGGQGFLPCMPCYHFGHISHNSYISIICPISHISHISHLSNIREGFQKRKWQFLMEFSMKAGGVSSSIKVFSLFLLTIIQNHYLIAKTRFAHSLSFILVEVTLNRAECGSQSSDQPENINSEPIIRGLKEDNFDWDQV